MAAVDSSTGLGASPYSLFLSPPFGGEFQKRLSQSELPYPGTANGSPSGKYVYVTTHKHDGCAVNT